MQNFLPFTARFSVFEEKLTVEKGKIAGKPRLHFAVGYGMIEEDERGDPMKIMAVDLGKARTGIAVSDIGERLASPVGTITEYVDERLIPKIADIAREQRAEMIVVGHPKNMDGTRGDSARRAEDIAEKLEKLTGLPVKLWDERMTTVSAIGYLNQNDVRGKKRKQVVDTVAATIILQDFLDSRK